MLDLDRYGIELTERRCDDIRTRNYHFTLHLIPSNGYDAAHTLAHGFIVGVRL